MARKQSSVGRFLKSLLTPENLKTAGDVARKVAQGVDFISAASGHECSSQCWHFPGFEGEDRDLVRCTCRWEEGIDRFLNGSSHAETCWVHRIYLERGGLGCVSATRVEEGLWRVQAS